MSEVKDRIFLVIPRDPEEIPRLMQALNESKPDWTVSREPDNPQAIFDYECFQREHGKGFVVETEKPVDVETFKISIARVIGEVRVFRNEEIPEVDGAIVD